MIIWKRLINGLKRLSWDDAFLLIAQIITVIFIAIILLMIVGKLGNNELLLQIIGNIGLVAGVVVLVFLMVAGITMIVAEFKEQRQERRKKKNG